MSSVIYKLGAPRLVTLVSPTVAHTSVRVFLREAVWEAHLIKVDSTSASLHIAAAIDKLDWRRDIRGIAQSLAGKHFTG